MAAAAPTRITIGGENLPPFGFGLCSYLPERPGGRPIVMRVKAKSPARSEASKIKDAKALPYYGTFCGTFAKVHVALSTHT